MSNSQSGYLLGIGSNIDPYDNIQEIISSLLDYYPQLSLSRVLSIPPIGMNSTRDFLNVAIFIETDDKTDKLKQICNAIEIKLGRNRNDPNRKTKDRPADLDILTDIKFPDDAQRAAHTITDEYFLYPLLDELIAYLNQVPFNLKQAGVEISLDNLTFGQTATTINRDAGTSDKRVIEQALNR